MTRQTIRTMRLFLLLFSWLLAWQSAPAQKPYTTSPFPDGSNPAIYGLSPEKNHTRTGTFYQVTGGSLRAPYEPPVSHRYGVDISSARQVRKTVLHGQASYVRHNRKNQTYGGLFHPSTPLVAFSDTIPGNQKGETYHLSGTVAHPVSSHWNLGLTIEYTGGNNAKDTDPRNLNTLNSILLKPGIGYSLGKTQFGFGFYYLRERENVNYQSFGAITKNGMTFYPLWFYKVESFQNGINTGRTYHRDIYNATCQFVFKGEEWDIFFQPEYSPGKEKIWIDHSTRQSAGEIKHHATRLSSRIGRKSRLLTHTFNPAFSFNQTMGYDEQQQLSSNNQIYETMLRIKRFQIDHAIFTAHYRLCPTPVAPTISSPWEAIMKFGYIHRRTSFHIYPDNFVQSLSAIQLSVGGGQTFQIHKNTFEYQAVVNYTDGHGRHPGISKQYENTILRANPELSGMEYRYLTARTTGASLRLQHSRPLHPANPLVVYSVIRCDFCQAIGRSSKEGNNYALLLDIGIRF